MKKGAQALFLEREDMEGKRLEDNNKGAPGRKGKIALACGAGVLALLAVGYLALCALAGRARALPGTYMGEVDLSGMTQAQAQAALERVSTDRYQALEIPIQVGDETVTFSAKQAGVQVLADPAEAVQAGKGNFFAGGWNYLAGLLGGKRQVGFEVRAENAAYVNGIYAQAAQMVDQPVEQPHWELEEDEQTARVILYQGRTGQSVDQAALAQALEDALGAGEAAPIVAEIRAQAPDQPDYAALAQDIDRPGANATLDTETDEIVPHKLGLKVDVDRAREILDGLAEGESQALELEVEVPEITTEQLRAALFRDVLGEATSKVSGTANRLNNVQLAAASCDGIILLPGERFSYNTATGERSAARGYKPAPGYTANGSVDMLGGGVCQPSSTLYYACLKADLEIVERHNHRYNVGYVPDGMDATVSAPRLDYVFANNTPYPIKIELEVKNRVCTARILGAKTTDTYVETESKSYAYVPYQTVYQADESVPQGTTKVLTSPHTGRTAEAYKLLYAADGTLISRTLISKDKYAACNQVIGYNPLDGAPDGSVAPTGGQVDLETGLPLDENGNIIETGTEGQPPAETTPAEGQTPAETTPAEGQIPAETTPAEGQTPVEQPPAEGQTPVETPPAEGQPPAETTPAEGQPPVEQPPAEQAPPEGQPPAEQPPAETPPAGAPQGVVVE